VTVITGMVKRKVDPGKKKGELMESNMDAMEVYIDNLIYSLDFLYALLKLYDYLISLGKIGSV